MRRDLLYDLRVAGDFHDPVPDGLPGDVDGLVALEELAHHAEGLGLFQRDRPDGVVGLRRPSVVGLGRHPELLALPVDPVAREVSELGRAEAGVCEGPNREVVDESVPGRGLQELVEFLLSEGFAFPSHVIWKAEFPDKARILPENCRDAGATFQTCYSGKS